MWPYYPHLLETPVPRYTSFPTAAEFSNAVGAAEQVAALREIAGPLSLYVHIPFCEQICWYCGCNTGAANRRLRLENYLDSLHREISLVSGHLGRGAKVRRIAFGGGSPNAVAPTDFVRLVDALTLHFALDEPVWSIELDPRTLAPEWGLVLSFIGVQRASMGVQTFARHLQEAIGRVQPEAEIERAVALLRKAGITSLNFDLMYGLPGQSLDDLESTLKRSIEMGADRLALFGYAHVPHLIPRQRRIDASHLPGQPQRFAMAEFGYDLLTQAGFVPVGFDHFARPEDPLAQAVARGQLHRNFQGFTDDPASSLIGLGASAISSFSDLIVQNEKNAGRYQMLLSQARLPGAVGVVRSPADRQRGKLIESLLCQGEVRLGAECVRQYRAALAPFIERGLARLDGGVLRILPVGLPYARGIAALFDPYRQGSSRRFSSAV